MESRICPVPYGDNLRPRIWHPPEAGYCNVLDGETVLNVCHGVVCLRRLAVSCGILYRSHHPSFCIGRIIAMPGMIGNDSCN